MDGRKTRCFDRFVRYPYPSQATSLYQKEFKTKKCFSKPNKQSFNLEKESRIINPHRMDLQTTQKQVHNGEKGRRADAVIRKSELGERPMMLSSNYSQNFVDWRNGNQDVYIEKHP